MTAGPATRSSRWSWLAPAALFAAVLAAYAPALRGGFIWDDDGHVTRPDLQSLHGLGRIWFQVGATQQYYPVLHSAFWLEHRLWGQAPFGYHLLNILLHATAACLVAVVLKRLAAPAAWLAAFLFALHPVCVESVAWISEEKNTLSTVFYLLSVLVYLRFDETRRPRAWAGALALFALALLSKTVTATLPAALLVILWWRHGRLGWKRDVRPLAPWFVLAAAAGLMTSWVETTFIGARGGSFDLGLAGRVLVAGRVVLFYLGKLVWPRPLIFIYPRWRIDPHAAWAYADPAAVLAGLALLWGGRRRFPGTLAAALFFVGSLFPALGFVNVYPFVFSYVADHFQYLASLGFFAAAAAGAVLLTARLPRPARAVLAGAVLVLLGGLTFRQCGEYRDLETLYATTVARNPDSFLAQENLGVVLAAQGRLDAAVEHYREALRLNPDFAETHNNYGNALARMNRWPEAAAQYAEALRLRPNFGQAAANWARADYQLANELANAGRLDEAMGRYREAIRLLPGYGEAYANLGLALAYANRLDEAAEVLRQAVRLAPRYPAAHANLGFTLARLGRLPEAEAELQTALGLDPGNPDIAYQLEAVRRAEGRR